MLAAAAGANDAWDAAAAHCCGDNNDDDQESESDIQPPQSQLWSARQQQTRHYSTSTQAGQQQHNTTKTTQPRTACQSTSLAIQAPSTCHSISILPSDWCDCRSRWPIHGDVTHSFIVVVTTRRVRRMRYHLRWRLGHWMLIVICWWLMSLVIFIRHLQVKRLCLTVLLFCVDINMLMHVVILIHWKIFPRYRTVVVNLLSC